MFFLLRVAFWLGLVFVLLPTGKSDDSDKTTKPVDPMQAATAAAAVMSDMSQFCIRQPTACEVGGKAAIAVGERAQSGARKVYQFITDKTDGKAEAKTESRPEKADVKKHDKKHGDHTGSIGDIVAASKSTLTDDDLAVEWQAPADTPAQD
jgi:Family of unknown function (DUF5330)